MQSVINYIAAAIMSLCLNVIVLLLSCVITPCILAQIPFSAIEAGAPYDGPHPRARIAFITGFFGTASSDKPVLVPPINEESKRNPLQSWYFVSNDLELCKFSQSKGYSAVWKPVDTNTDAMDSAEIAAYYARLSKQIKVYPEAAVGPGFDFIVYFDHKYILQMDGVMRTLALWEGTSRVGLSDDIDIEGDVGADIDTDIGDKGDHEVTVTDHEDVAKRIAQHLTASPTAMMLHGRPACLSNHSLCGADVEFEASLLQPRYAVYEQQMRRYMAEEAALGFHVHGGRHFQTGFILYNMHHPDTAVIKDLWYAHIQRVGIHCQLAFYFVAQRYLPAISTSTSASESSNNSDSNAVLAVMGSDSGAIREYTLDWNYGRMGVLVVYDDEEEPEKQPGEVRYFQERV